MMWAAIPYNRRIVRVLGNLMAQRHRDNILQPQMLNAIHRQREMFQQDNAGFEPHRTFLGQT